MHVLRLLNQIFMKKLIFLPLFFIVMITDCSKKSNIPLNLSGLPNTVGNNYTYYVTDSSGGKLDSSFEVKVAIVGNSNLSDGTPVTIWTFTYPNYIDTNYVLSNKDSAIFYDNTKTYITNNYYFPLTIGERWSKPFKDDTLTVLDQASITIGIGKFDSAYLIHEHGSAENYSFNKDQWFVLGIGMIKMNMTEYYFGSPETQDWELISYNVN
jgi:hypothetical protein